MPAGITLRDHYTAQEDQAPDFAVPYTDFGARQYNVGLRRWMTPDPLSEKYYGISPYAFCAGNPVVYIDYNGESIGKVVKVGKKVYKTIKTGKKLNLKNILKSEVIDIADNVRTIFSEDATWFERGFAVIDLATGFGDEAKWLAKTVGVSDGIVDGAKAADAFDDIADAAKITAPPSSFNKFTLAPTTKTVKNPYGAKGKLDHQAKVSQLKENAKAELKPGEIILSEGKIRVNGSNRKPDVQIIDNNGKTRKVFEAERYPNRKRNRDRENEYKMLNIEYETHSLY